MQYFADRYDADGLWYVFDEDRGGTEVRGPFGTFDLALAYASRLNAESESVTTEPRRFLGSEIAPAIVEAFSLIPEGREIVEVKAGENMTIEVILAPQDISVTTEFITYWWDGERWNEYPA